jgi:hypothetical protein
MVKTKLLVASGALAALLLPRPVVEAQTATAEPPAAAARKEPEKKQALLWPASEIKWTDDSAIKGARTAVLWGDPAQEGYGKINRWPAGTEAPLHWHTFETRSVVMEGTLTVTLEGESARELGPGSYLYMPGKVKHVTTCKPGAECVFMTTSRLRFETKLASTK